MRTPRPPLRGASLVGITCLLILLGCGDDRGSGPTGPGEPEPPPTPVPDVTAPSVSLVLPTPDAELRGMVQLRAHASDNVRVIGIQFLVDGEPVGAEGVSSPYRLDLDTRTLGDGSHTLAARARDAAGLATVSDPVSVAIYNDPGVVELTIQAPDGLDDADGFQLYLDGVVVPDISGTGTHTLTDLPVGTHRLTLGGLPPFCGSDAQAVKVRSTAPTSAVLTIRCLAEAAEGWMLVSRQVGTSLQLGAVSLRTGKETVLVPRLAGLGAVSADGTRLAFADDGTLMIGDLDAFAPAAVASVPGAWDVSWSPDGTALVLSAERGLMRDLFIVNADGTDLHPLFETPGYRRRPTWSATGRIAFEAVSGGPMGDLTTIVAADADGGNEASVTSGVFDESPAWSPDGTRLAFTRWSYISSSNQVHVAIVNADGTGIEPVVGEEALAFPVWSPDGMWILHSIPGSLRATHVSGGPTMPATDYAAHPLGWVAGSRFD